MLIQSEKILQLFCNVKVAQKIFVVVDLISICFCNGQTMLFFIIQFPITIIEPSVPVYNNHVRHLSTSCSIVLVGAISKQMQMLNTLKNFLEINYWNLQKVESIFQNCFEEVYFPNSFGEYIWASFRPFTFSLLSRHSYFKIILLLLKSFIY